jgi:two-component system, chemotaxis family, CheB/CheR fusion protein
MSGTGTGTGPIAVSPDVMLVGIGASAGGLEALEELFSKTPGDTGLAFAVVVHLAPDHPSALADLLQPFTPMRVQQVCDDVPVAPNHVYVIPPGCNLSTIDSHLRVSELEGGRSERAPIDHFFETLGAAYGEKAIGIVLSGTGTDGSFGIKKIKEHGGLTIAQDPSEAQFDGMPHSAIATRLVDLVLPVDQMIQHMLRYAAIRPRIDIVEEHEQQGERDHQDLQQIFAHIRSHTGHDFSRYKRSTVLRRIRRRMQLHQKELLHDYLQLLRDSPAEVQLLAEEFLITVTQFFRDAETFDYLTEEVLPRLFEGTNGADRLRVWSVGCATGEEAYSLAMLLLEEAERHTDPPAIEVFASDLHDGSLQRAREGLYPDTIETDVSEERLDRFFEKEDNSYRVGKSVRETVVFASHNLLTDPPFSRLHLIVCRNVLIYLQRSAQNDVIDTFHYALNPDGLLLLGPSESVEHSPLFQPENKRHCLYRRRNIPASRPRHAGVAWLSDARSRAEPAVSYGVLHQKMVERYACPSIIVDQDLRIVHASEHAGRYLQVPGGEMSSNVFKLVREELRIELRAALQAVRERGGKTRTTPVPLQLDGVDRYVVMHVRPSRDPKLSGLSLIMFDEMETTDEPPVTLSARDQAELEQTRERLRAVIAQYESSQEEMKAANEELQSTNEELRSTMEELETSREDLQSINEELQTVNQENRHKVEELSQLTSDLNNLIAATEIATLFLDRQLRILRVTPRVRELFNVRQSDRGRPLTELRHRLGYQHLEEDARRVLERLVPIEREIQSECGEWYLTRVLPYRTPTDQIKGVVITLVEITQLKQAELALRDSEESFRALVTASAQIVWTTDAEGKPVEDSPSWRAFTGQSIEQWHATGWWDAIHPDERQAVTAAWQDCLRSETPLDTEFRLKHVSGEWRWTQVRAVPCRGDDGKVSRWVGMNMDITTRKLAEQELREVDRRKDECLAMLGHELRNPLAPLRTAAELFRQLLPPDPRIQQVREMNERQVLHLTRLVDDLLDVMRIKAGRIELEMNRVDLREVTRCAVVDVESAMQRRRHHLSVEQSLEPLEIEGDEERLVQVISNLLDNAAKYTPEGGRIRVGTRREGQQAVVCVADSGIGIADHMIGGIFDVFSRGYGDSPVSAKGLGLGLTLVQRLTRLHGGTVEARSRGPGEGAEFIVRLPLAPARDDAPVRRDVAARPPEAPRTAPSARRILVVDDNHDVADSLALALELAGHEVRRAYDGKRALALADRFAPEAVILDIGLPDMDGRTLARELRSREALSSAVLIAVTGYGSDDGGNDGSGGHIDHYLVKPVDFATLEAALERGAHSAGG